MRAVLTQLEKIVRAQTGIVCHTGMLGWRVNCSSFWRIPAAPIHRRSKSQTDERIH